MYANNSYVFLLDLTTLNHSSNKTYIRILDSLEPFDRVDRYPCIDIVVPQNELFNKLIGAGPVFLHRHP